MFQFLFHSRMMSHSTPKRGASRTRSFRGDGADDGEEVTEESIIEGTQDRTEHESDYNVFAWEEYDPDNHNMIHSRCGIHFLKRKLYVCCAQGS